MYSDLESLNSLLNYTTNDNYKTWLIVALILGFMGSILAYFLFVKPSKKYDSKFVNWLRKFLNFDAKVIEPLAKITYMFLTIYYIVISFSYISTDFLTFLYNFIVYPVVIRMGYEVIMLISGIYKNTKEK